ncbi:MAG: hypothetical protein WB760_26465 [Xanthobacteraceae bacterium]
MRHLVRFLFTLFLIVALAAAITAEIFAASNLRMQVDPAAFVIIVAAAIIFDFAALFFVARINAGVISRRG